MRSWNYLEQLARLPARGSATEGERTAARWLQEQLETLGYDVEMQSFQSPRHTLYLGPTMVIVILLATLWLSRSVPAVAALLAAAAFVPLVGEMLGADVNFNLLLPKSPSQNVVARPGRRILDEGADAADSAGPDAAARNADSSGTAKASPDVVVVAHYDTQWGSWLFAPGFRRFLQPFFIVTYAGLVLAFLAIVFRWIFAEAQWPNTMASIAAVLLVVTGAFLFGSWLFGRPVPGANDNGSGVAVALALADRWMEQAKLDGGPPVTPWFVFTGCEEVGLRGMHRFLADASLGRDTIFINLDNVGGGRLRYFLGEGMLAYQKYDAGLIEVAADVAERHGGHVKPLKNWLLPTDGLLPAKAGFRAISFLAMSDDQTIPNYHWHSDTIENVDRDVVELTEQFVWEFLETAAERSRIAS